MNFVRVSILVSFVAFMGCGPSGPAMGPVKGKVTLGGKPYTNGIVTFTPEGGGPSGTGATNSEGIYELFSAGVKGAKVGKNKRKFARTTQAILLLEMLPTTRLRKNRKSRFPPSTTPTLNSYET